MGKFLIGLIIGILLVPTGFYLYLRSGRAPVATSAPPMPFERFLVGTAMRATITPQLPKVDPSAPSDAALVSGAKVYRQNCSVCHGLPDEKPTAISKGMFPHPPQFFRHPMKAADNADHSYRPGGPGAYWKAKNGIRLSGMPGFHDSLNDDQIWQVSEFLANRSKLPPAAAAELHGAATPESSPQPKPASAPHSHPKH